MNTQKTTERRPKRPMDFNQLAAQVVAEAVGDVEPEYPEEKNPAAVERGRQGGLKGGKARAEELTPERRRNIARKASNSRWLTVVNNT